MIRHAVLVAALLAAAPAAAHGGEDHGTDWTLEPWIVLPLLVALVLFAIGWLALQKRAAHADLGRRAWLFLAGWLVLALALLSPLHEAGERSFAAHMLEHELIMLLAAPLLVLSRPAVILLWGFSRGTRRVIGAGVAARPVRALWHWLTGAIPATFIQAVVLWTWHMPALFDLALGSEAWHAAQHASFLASALLFWTAMIGDARGRPEGLAKAALCLFASSLVSGVLGALMAFSQSPWYAPYAALGMAPYGLTPTEDQQIAGLIMWIPGGLVHAAAALAAVFVLLRNTASPKEPASARQS